MNIAIIGAGWAGMAAAVRAVRDGHRVTVFEAARTLGGRARGVPLVLPDGRELMADNGQHILIGAYADSLRLMRMVGVDPAQALLRLPLALVFPDDTGLQLPDWPAPWDALAGIARARGWSWRNKWALLGTASRWQRAGFQCAADASVADLCAALPPALMREFIEPLCVSALNTPPAEASGTVFLRVLQDGLFSQRGGSNLLLPRVDLSALFPEPAARWLEANGARVRAGRRVNALHWQAPHWVLDGEPFDRVILAVPASDAVRSLEASIPYATQSIANEMQAWMASTAALGFRAIATVYAQAKAPARRPLLARPMLALRPDAGQPAQFVFERDQINDSAAPTHVLAFVVSAAQGERSVLDAAIAAQAQSQLGLAVTPLQTIVEKRATFACTPGLVRPAARIAPGLVACGDYVQGPYPATLEGAVRSGWAALDALDMLS